MEIQEEPIEVEEVKETPKKIIKKLQDD